MAHSKKYETFHPFRPPTSTPLCKSDDICVLFKHYNTLLTHLGRKVIGMLNTYEGEGGDGFLQAQIQNSYCSLVMSRLRELALFVKNNDEYLLPNWLPIVLDHFRCNPKISTEVMFNQHVCAET